MTNEELLAKIKAEIEKRLALMKELVERKGTCDFALGSIDALQGLLDTVISPKYTVRNPIFDECVANVDPEVMEEVERNIELENELVRFYLKELCASEKDELTDATRYHHFPIMWDDLRDIALHFYELGCRRTAEKYDEIEYNRQREEEKPMDLDEELNDEIKKYIEEYGYEKGADKLLIAIVARHFAEWQKEQNDKDLSEKIAAAYQLGLADKEKQMLKEAVEGRVSYFESRDVAVIYYDDPKGNTMCYFAPSSSLETGDKVRIIVCKKED